MGASINGLERLGIKRVLCKHLLPQGLEVEEVRSGQGNKGLSKGWKIPHQWSDPRATLRFTSLKPYSCVEP